MKKSAKEKKKCCQKSEDLDILMNLLNGKLLISLYEDQFKLLTLKSSSRSVSETQSFFCCSLIYCEKEAITEEGKRFFFLFFFFFLIGVNSMEG